jgi:arylsulfatase A-like enzyme
MFNGWFTYAQSIGVVWTAWEQWIGTGGQQWLQAVRSRRAGSANRLIAAANEALRDKELGFVFVHLPIPHPPGVSLDELDGSEDHSYLDNLKLADQVLGSFRRTLEEEGTWDRSTVVLVADHGFRPWPPYFAGGEDSFSYLVDPLHVPLMLKMPRQDVGVPFDAPVSSAIIYDLSIEILNGRISDAAGAVEWLRERSADYPPACLHG